jgi:hypothetical protein
MKRVSPVTLQYKLLYLRFCGEFLPPVLPVFRSHTRHGLPLPPCFDSPHNLAKSRILRAKPNMIAVEKDSAGADERCHLPQQPSQLRGVKPVERGRAENGIHRRFSQPIEPGGIAKISFHPAQPAPKITKRSLAESQESRIEVHANAAGTRKSLE